MATSPLRPMTSTPWLAAGAMYLPQQLPLPHSSSSSSNTMLCTHTAAADDRGPKPRAAVQSTAPVESLRHVNEPSRLPTNARPRPSATMLYASGMLLCTTGTRYVTKGSVRETLIATVLLQSSLPHSTGHASSDALAARRLMSNRRHSSTGSTDRGARTVRHVVFIASRVEEATNEGGAGGLYADMSK